MKIIQTTIFHITSRYWKHWKRRRKRRIPHMLHWKPQSNKWMQLHALLMNPFEIEKIGRNFIGRDNTTFPQDTFTWWELEEVMTRILYTPIRGLHCFYYMEEPKIISCCFSWKVLILLPITKLYTVERPFNALHYRISLLSGFLYYSFYSYHYC